MIARGWRRYGLKLPPRSEIFDIFNKWRVMYHGTRPEVFVSILVEGRLMTPGDTLITGKTLKAVNSAGRQMDRVRSKLIDSAIFYPHYVTIHNPDMCILFD